MINIDRPGRFRLANAPLMQALTQVQFPLIAHLETLPGVAGLQDALLNDLPYMQQMPLQEFSLGVGPAGVAAPQSAQRTVTRFTNDDQWALEVQAGSATLTAPGETYDGSAHFGEVFGHVGHQLARRRRLEQLLVHHHVERLAEERQPAGQQLVKNDPQRVHIAERGNGLAADLLDEGDGLLIGVRRLPPRFRVLEFCLTS